jgi:hypothetical protein
MAKKSTTKKRIEKKTKNKEITFESLFKWNRALALVHLLQGLIIMFLAQSSAFPVTTNFLTLNTLATEASGNPVLAPASTILFEVNLAYIVVAFFFMSAIAHAIIASKYLKKYEAGLKVGINRARWIEYAISASTMMVGIGLLSGVYDISSLLMMFGLTAVMNLCGLAMELHNQTTKTTNWTSYIVGSLSGIIPWIVLGIYFWGANIYGSGNIPTFVYFIYVSIFVFFFSFALNMYLQYKKKGKWADYLYGEKVYMILSLVAKSALAWQIFFGALRP